MTYESGLREGLQPPPSDPVYDLLGRWDNFSPTRLTITSVGQIRSHQNHFWDQDQLKSMTGSDFCQGAFPCKTLVCVSARCLASKAEPK